MIWLWRTEASRSDWRQPRTASRPILVAAHAKAVHNVETVPPEVVDKVRQVMRKE